MCADTSQWRDGDAPGGLTPAELSALAKWEQVLDQFIEADGPAMPASRIKTLLALVREIGQSGWTIHDRLSDYDYSKVARDISRLEGRTRMGNALPPILEREQDGSRKVIQWSTKGRMWRSNMLRNLME